MLCATRLSYLINHPDIIIREILIKLCLIFSLILSVLSLYVTKYRSFHFGSNVAILLTVLTVLYKPISLKDYNRCLLMLANNINFCIPLV